MQKLPSSFWADRISTGLELETLASRLMKSQLMFKRLGIFILNSFKKTLT